LSTIKKNKEDNIKELIKKEYSKCATDPAYFIKTYVKIKHPKRGIIPFYMFPFQEDTLNVMLSTDRLAINKGRQMGMSTLSAAYSLWLMTFHDNQVIYTVATKQRAAVNLIKKVKVAYDNLPSWLKEPLSEDNKLSVAFANGSSITAGSAASDEGRSEAVSLFIIDEAAHIKANVMKELWGAIQPTLSTGGSMIVLSTPNGVGNWFHQIYSGGVEGTNGFTSIFLHWSLHPERDKKWRAKQDKELGIRKAKQEVDGEFLSSGDAVFDGELIEEYIKNNSKDPIEKPIIDKGVWIWNAPKPNTKYILAADTSRGDSGDFSSFEIFDIEHLEQVAEFNGKLNTTEFANLCIKYATMYNDAVLIPENNGLGWATVQTILDRGYRNLFYSETDFKWNDPGKLKANGKKKKVPGFSNSPTTRPLCINKFITLFEEGSIDIKSKRLLNQMKVFIWNGKKAEAMSGYNDDMILTTAIGLYVRDMALIKYNTYEDDSKKLVDSIIVSYNNNEIKKRWEKETKQQINVNTGKNIEDMSWV